MWKTLPPESLRTTSLTAVLVVGCRCANLFRQQAALLQVEQRLRKPGMQYA